MAAYSYMALVPIIQPPVMKLFTTKKERAIKMENLRPVSKLERILFPVIVTTIVCLILPTTAPLVGMLMLVTCSVSPSSTSVNRYSIQCINVYRCYLTGYFRRSYQVQRHS